MALLWIIPACILAAGAVLLRAYFRLLALDGRCVVAAADVEAALDRRHAMLPALVGLARAFAPNQRDATDAVVKLHAAVRRAATPQSRLLAQTRLADAIHRLLVKTEAVPQLRNLEDFSALRAALGQNETDLTAARRRLGAATEAYNLALTRFPMNLFAIRLRLAHRVFYDIGLEQRCAPEACA
jgi:LemA protein